jgi:5-methylcytosine-specific restriction endonuclease McrA
MAKCGISYDLRLSIYERDGYKCYRCGRIVKAGAKRRRKGFPLATLDHYIPKKIGGTNHACNLKTCCDKCNNSKGSKVPKVNIWLFLLGLIALGINPLTFAHGNIEEIR